MGSSRARSLRSIDTKSGPDFSIRERLSPQIRPAQPARALSPLAAALEMRISPTIANGRYLIGLKRQILELARETGISPSALTRETQAISDQLGIPVVIVLADRGFGIFWPQREPRRCIVTPSENCGDDMIELLLADNPNLRK